MTDVGVWVPSAGVDEAGRGPLAGPVIAAAVILDRHQAIDGLADSKTLSPLRREIIAKDVLQRALAVAVGRAEVDEIDDLNILQATLLAMKRAVEALKFKPGMVLVDGNQSPVISLPVQCIVKGDSRIPEISAASIVAKVTRDSEMQILDRLYPGYGFSRNMGYPTKEHLAALQSLGPCPVHRHSFAPVIAALKHGHSDG